MRRALQSCAAHISGACISIDPAFPEDALTVQAECMRLGLPCRTFESPRVTGGQMRTDVMREGEKFAASLGAAYVVNLDADDELRFAAGFRWPTDGADVYWIEEHCSGLTYPFKRLFKVGLGWRWHGPIHEEPYCDASPLDAPAPYAQGVRYIKHVDGERGPDAVVYGRHADICRAWLAEHPQDHRWAYYLGQSLHAAGRIQEAVTAYEAFLERPDGAAPQRYLAARAIAEIAQREVTPTDLLTVIQRLIEVAPERAEPWRRIEALAKHVADGLPVPSGAVMLDESAYRRRG